MEMRNDEMKSIKYNVMKVAIYTRVSTEDPAKERYSLTINNQQDARFALCGHKYSKQGVFNAAG